MSGIREIYDYVLEYAQQGVCPADLSQVDQNANCTNRNVASLNNELFKQESIQLSRLIVQENLYNTDIADISDFLSDITNGAIYVHDESHPLFPYCVAIDSTPFLMDGLKTVNGKTRAPKHLSSFVGSYSDLLFIVSSQFAGAVADVSFLKNFHYFAKKDYGTGYLENHKSDISQFIEQLIYKVNTPGTARGSQSIFYNTSVFDKFYFEGLYGNAYYPDGQRVMDNWEEINSLQKFFMQTLADEKKKELLPFPVVTAALLTKDGEILSEDWKKFLANQFSQNNTCFIYMNDSVSSLSSCCRLRNDLWDNEENTFSYTLGGTGISTGSKKVISMNLAQLVQKPGDFFDNLVKLLKRVHCYLIAYDKWFHYLLQSNLLDIYRAGYISMDKQFLTVGLIGVVECAEFLGYDISYNKDYESFLKRLFNTIKHANTIASKDYSEELGRKIRFNTELVPGESAGAKLYRGDRKQGYRVPDDINLYNSYLFKQHKFLPIIEKLNLYKKDIIDNLDGGSALHLNFNERPNQLSLVGLFECAAKIGVNYFTINIPRWGCGSCDAMFETEYSKCPNCKSTEILKATRIIGYEQWTQNFSSDRKTEEKLRLYIDL